MTEFVPPEAEGLALALAIGLLLGVERGWQLREEASGKRVAGIRTFALLGLLGGIAGIAVQGPGAWLALVLVGGAVIAMLLGYAADMRIAGNVSATSTLAAVLAIALGAMATTNHMAIASVGAGAATVLLASREVLHRAIRLTSDSDIKALLRLVLVVFVILPLLPDRGMGPYAALNPYRLWTVVAITAAISFIGYGLVRWLGEKRGAVLTAAVGSLVSSTAVTVESARRIRDDAAGWEAQAGVAIASLVMLLRSLVLVSLLAPFALVGFARLILPGLLASALCSAILLWLGRRAASGIGAGRPKPPGLGLAFLFATSVALLSLASAFAQAHWGGNSGAILIAVGGIADIDAAIAAVGAMPQGTLGVEAAALALAAPGFFNTTFKLALFVGFAGWRRSMAGAAALALVAVALLVPLLRALL